MIWLPGDGSVQYGPPREVLAASHHHSPAGRARPRGRLGRRAPQRARGPAAGAQRGRPAGRTPTGRPPAGNGGASRARGRASASATWPPSAASTSTCAAGSVTALLGRNGAGKSSLLWALQGALTCAGDIVGRRPRPRAGSGRAGPPAGHAGAADRGRPALPAHASARSASRPTARATSTTAPPPAAAAPAWASTCPPTVTRATCPRASGSPWCWPSSWPRDRRCCCWTSPPAASTTAPKADLHRHHRPARRDGHGCRDQHPRRRVRRPRPASARLLMADGERDRRRPTPRPAHLVAGLRPADGEGVRAGARSSPPTTWRGGCGDQHRRAGLGSR